jgi:hypothetical protein
LTDLPTNLNPSFINSFLQDAHVSLQLLQIGTNVGDR